MWRIKAFFGWLKWKISQIATIQKNKKEDPYIYPPD